METSSTYPKFSFLRFIFTCLAVPLLLFAPGLMGAVYGQTKVLADEITYSSPNVPDGLLDFPPYDQETVENPLNAVDGDAGTFARLNASPGLLAGLGAFGGTIELKFPGASNLPAGTTSYIKLNASDALLSALLGGSLGDLLGDVVSTVALGAHVFDVEAIDNSDAVVYTTSSSNQFAGTNARIVSGIDGSMYLVITPAAAYNRIRISNETTALLGLSILQNPKTLDVYEAFYVTGAGDCDPAFITYFDGTGISLSLLNLGATGVINPQNAIDADANTFSEINLGLVGVAASMSQYIDFPTVSTPQHHFTVKLAINTSSTLSAELLGAYEVIAWNGTEQVYKRSLAGGIINGLDALSLLQNGQPATFTFGPSKEFDRIEIRVNGLIGLNISSSVEVYDVKRYGPGCEDPNLPTPTETPGPLEIPSCASELVAFEHVDFAANATDGNNETYATINASNGTLLVSSSVAGYIEMALPTQLAANQTSYVRIDVEDDILDRLVNGSIGQLLSGVGGLLLGDHYFTVEAKLTEGGTAVLSGSSNDTFDGTTGGVVTIVQDKIGRYYIAITPNVPYQYIRITDHVSSLLGTGVQKSMKVYNLCYETSDNTCFPAFATSADGSGVTLGTALGNGAGVTNADNAISDNSSDYSEISLGT